MGITYVKIYDIVIEETERVREGKREGKGVFLNQVNPFRYQNINTEFSSLPL